MAYTTLFGTSEPETSLHNDFHLFAGGDYEPISLSCEDFPIGLEDDLFDDDEDDLKAITNLDQILDREGIDLAAEDPTVNILTMYGAGLSIIEISKVLKMGVGEVKYIIDSNTKNQ